MRGADTVVKEVVRTAIGKVFDKYFADVNTQQIEQWFNLGGTTKIEDGQSAKATLEELRQIQGLFEKLSPLGVKVLMHPRSWWGRLSFSSRACAPHRRVERERRAGIRGSEEGSACPRQERSSAGPGV